MNSIALGGACTLVNNLDIDAIAVAKVHVHAWQLLVDANQIKRNLVSCNDREGRDLPVVCKEISAGLEGSAKGIARASTCKSISSVGKGKNC